MDTKRAGRDFIGLCGIGCASLVLGMGAVGCDSQRGQRTSGGFGIDVPDADDDPETEDEPEDEADSGGPSEPTEPADDPDDDEPGEPAAQEPEVPFDPAKVAEVCARNNGDRVAQALCSGAPIGSLDDLRAQLEFQSPFFALTANSTSLVGRVVSAINPRLIIGERSEFFDTQQSDLLAMGFARGEQEVELVGYDPVTDDLNFYLLLFQQDCNTSPEGCDTADLVTPAIEHNWTGWTLYQDTDLVNKTVDCLTCHQPMGPGTPKVPRMQELNNSWTHWFPMRPQTGNAGGGWGSSSGSTGTSSGLPPQSDEHGTRSSETLWPLFERMHEVDGSYGSVPMEELREAAAGPDMENFVANYLTTRQLPDEMAFPSFLGGSETTDYFCDSSAMELQAEDSTWLGELQRVVDGDRLPLPSHRIDISAEAKREAAIESYLGVMGDFANPDELLDPRDVMDDAVLTELSFAPRADASAQEILTHMCARCHNDNLDPSLSRAKFDAKSLLSLTGDQKLMIADRIGRSHDDKYLMPPERFGRLPDWAVERVLTWLDL